MEWLTTITDSVQQLLPRILGAAGLLFAGLILAATLRFLAGRLAKRLLERTNRHAPTADAVDNAGVRSSFPQVIMGFVFWVVFLLFAAAAIESLGFTVVTGVLSQIAYYLPNVFAAIVVAVAGVIIGKLVRRTVSAAARSAGIVRAEGVGQVTQAAVLLVAAVIALEQIGIDAQLLVILVAVVIGAAVASAGLAFGIGAQTTVSSIVATYYTSQHYSVGQIVRIGDVEGEIVQFTPTAVMLSTAKGRLMVPAHRFNQEASLLLTDAA
ncbi:MAG: mechanosensitive ion channel [Gemmatimonadota bacterium]|nr:MAG: mechanosensitive ion channel [Gemmatimonadota bacterium]